MGNRCSGTWVTGQFLNILSSPVKSANQDVVEKHMDEAIILLIREQANRQVFEGPADPEPLVVEGDAASFTGLEKGNAVTRWPDELRKAHSGRGQTEHNFTEH
jgi:hypothetical protein